MKRLSLFGLLSLLLLLGSVPSPGAATSPGPYQWPIRPFDRQHPIRGAFGDPRTLSKDEPFGVTGPTRTGGYSFHNGVDIAARAGTPVYPVVSGTVVIARPHEIVVRVNRKRVFAYWHLHSNVTRGDEVVAGQTVLGWIQRQFDHVHFSEIDNGRARNPLAPGHLEPYRDTTRPHAIALDFDNGRSPKLTEGGLLARGDRLAIEALDPPAMRLRGLFADLPQAPVLVEWRLRSGGMWSRWHVAADFRRVVPRSSFWHVYAAGTYQNSPVFDRQLFSGVAGRYLFLTRLDPSHLAPGRYGFEARVTDIRGNASTRRWHLQIG